MSEEEKAIKWLDKKRKDYNLNSEDLHYLNILYYLITNLQQSLKDMLDINLENDKELINLQQELNEYKFPNCKTKDIEVVRANLVDMMRKNKRLEQERDEEIKDLQEDIKDLQERNEALLSSLIDQKRINHQQLSMVIKYNRGLKDYKSRCEKASDKLGNYKHYSTPTEEQNSENEDVVDSALNILQNRGEENDER